MILHVISCPARTLPSHGDPDHSRLTLSSWRRQWCGETRRLLSLFRRTFQWVEKGSCCVLSHMWAHGSKSLGKNKTNKSLFKTRDCGEGKNRKAVSRRKKVQQKSQAQLNRLLYRGYIRSESLCTPDSYQHLLFRRCTSFTVLDRYGSPT